MRWQMAMSLDRQRQEQVRLSPLVSLSSNVLLRPMILIGPSFPIKVSHKFSLLFQRASSVFRSQKILKSSHLTVEFAHSLFTVVAHLNHRLKPLTTELKSLLELPADFLIFIVKVNSHSSLSLALFSMKQMRCSTLASYLMWRRSLRALQHVSRRCSSRQQCLETSSLLLVAS
ncbi:unannotated protein [freshwater metagenome]|uniref:Unannotated protein n=1 Tax=freshwater metagenome TaxID=449393 RepID=A0A6J7NY02_9ZZZZ